MASASAPQLESPERMYPWESFVHIQQFLGTVTPSREQKTEAASVVNRFLTRVVTSAAGKELGVHVCPRVGSYSKKTALKDSDVNVLVQLHRFPPTNFNQATEALISLLRDEFPGCCLTMEPAGSIKATVGESPVHLDIKLSGTFAGLGGVSTYFAALPPEARHVWRPSLGEWQVDFFREKCKDRQGLREAVLCIKAWSRALGLPASSFLLELLAVYAADVLAEDNQRLLPPERPDPGTGFPASEPSLGLEAAGPPAEGANCQSVDPDTGDMARKLYREDRALSPVACLLAFAQLVQRLVLKQTPVICWRQGNSDVEQSAQFAGLESDQPHVIDPADSTNDIGESLSAEKWLEFSHHAARLEHRILSNVPLYHRLSGDVWGWCLLPVKLGTAPSTTALKNASMLVNEACQKQGLFLSATYSVPGGWEGSTAISFCCSLQLSCQCGWRLDYKGASAPRKQGAKEAAAASLLLEKGYQFHNQPADCVTQQGLHTQLAQLGAAAATTESVQCNPG